jgi:hypothetical protein
MKINGKKECTNVKKRSCNLSLRNSSETAKARSFLCSEIIFLFSSRRHSFRSFRSAARKLFAWKSAPETSGDTVHTHTNMCHSCQLGKTPRLVSELQNTLPRKNVVQQHSKFFATSPWFGFSHISLACHTHRIQGCQMVCFQTKHSNLGTFWWTLEWKMLLYIFGHICIIIYDHWAYLMWIWYFCSQFEYFPPALVYCTKKNLATLIVPTVCQVSTARWLGRNWVRPDWAKVRHEGKPKWRQNFDNFMSEVYCY